MRVEFVSEHLRGVAVDHFEIVGRLQGCSSSIKAAASDHHRNRVTTSNECSL
jgi:hypothetical protein